MDLTQAPKKPLHWGRAIKALVGLARDTQRTDHVFEIISALTGDSLEHTYQSFIASTHGQRMLRERPSLMDVLSDRKRLRAMPNGSLGRAYLDFMERGQLTPGGLVDAQDEAFDPGSDVELDPDRRYVADRLRDQHDLWHVLTGYGRDDTGEIANLWFSVGQFGNPGMGFIALMGTLDGALDTRFGWPRYCYRAWLRGKRALKLVENPIEDMLELPIEEVDLLRGG